MIVYKTKKAKKQINLKQVKKSKISLFRPKKRQICWIWKYFIKCVIKSDNNQIKMKNIQLSSKTYCIRDTKAKSKISNKSKNQKSPFFALKSVKFAGFGNISLNV